MLFTIKNNKYMSRDQLQLDALMNAYFVIKYFPLKASDCILDSYLQKQYKSDLKNLCLQLLLKLTSYYDDDNNLIFLFKNPKDDSLARLITFGNGAIPGSKILQIALKS